jgi:hypothetical protein
MVKTAKFTVMALGRRRRRVIKAALKGVVMAQLPQKIDCFFAHGKSKSLGIS